VTPPPRFEWLRAAPNIDRDAALRLIVELSEWVRLEHEAAMERDRDSTTLTTTGTTPTQCP